MRVGQIAVLIEQNEQLLAKDVRSEEEKAEYRSKNAVLEQRISDLDRSSKLNSHNSSKPPSSDGLSKETVGKKKKKKRTKSSRKKSDRKSGGQAGHKGTTLNQVENPDQIVDHTPDQCQDCSATLSKSDIVGFSSRQVFDIPKPPPLFVTEHRAHTCQCSECGAKVRAAFPDGVNAPVQYGNEIASLVAYLQTTQCLPDHRTAMLLSEWYRGREQACARPPAQIPACALTHGAPASDDDERPLVRPRALKPVAVTRETPTQGRHRKCVLHYLDRQCRVVVSTDRLGVDPQRPLSAWVSRPAGPAALGM